MQVGRGLHAQQRPSVRFSMNVAGWIAIVRDINNFSSQNTLPTKMRAHHHGTRFRSALAPESLPKQLASNAETGGALWQRADMGRQRLIPQYLPTLEALTDITGWTARPRHR